MSTPIIKVESLAKEYVIGGRRMHGTFRDMLGSGLSAPFRRFRKLSGQVEEEERFWALKDVSFEVEEGAIVGIIGRNGAGKSTLLKILSRITAPTEGRVEICGRVASLLEVGTGFHPELTGRENAYLNGAILGMSRAEITRKFDEIVQFAEIENFLDTPVKRYSSGMYVRLAFAVAAHLEPEILIVDEVLAVGDKEFQDKCLGRMKSLASSEGRTVLFVSHNLDAVARLCTHGIVLGGGKIDYMGSSADAVDYYLASTRKPTGELDAFREQHFRASAEILAVWSTSLAGRPQATFAQGEPFQICVTVRPCSLTPRDLGLVIENRASRALFATHLSDMSRPLKSLDATTFAIQVSEPCLRSGDYLISVASASPDLRSHFDVILHLPLFTVAGDINQFPSDHRWGDLYFPLKWIDRTKREDNAKSVEILDAARLD